MKKIQITGTIVDNDSKDIYEWLGINATAPRDVEKILNEANGEDVTIEINSGGGDVFAGNEIYYKLANYQGNITIDITGLAGSIASVIAMAGKVRMVPSGMIMIHNVSSGASGDYRDMQHQADVLKSANKAIANSYRVKTGMSSKDLLALMDKESWLSAEEALEKGFVDEIINDKNNVLSDKKINLSNNIGVNILSQEVIQNLKNKLFDSSIKEKDDSNFFMQKNKLKAQLKLMKLKGGSINEQR